MKRTKFYCVITILLVLLVGCGTQKGEKEESQKPKFIKGNVALGGLEKKQLGEYNPNKPQKLVYLKGQEKEAAENKELFDQINHILNRLGDPKKDIVEILPITDVVRDGDQIVFKVIIRNGFDHEIKNLSIWMDLQQREEPRFNCYADMKMGEELIEAIPAKTSIVTNFYVSGDKEMFDKGVFPIKNYALFTNATFDNEKGKEKIVKGSVFSKMINQSGSNKMQKFIFYDKQGKESDGSSENKEGKNTLKKIREFVNLMGDPEEDTVQVRPISSMEKIDGKLYFRVVIRNGYDYPITDLNIWGQVTSLEYYRTLFDFTININEDMIKVIPAKTTTTILLNIDYNEKIMDGIELPLGEFYLFTNTTFKKVEN